jgi:ferredoxin
VKISVDPDLCQSHGRCAFVAPAVFSLDSQLELAYEANPDQSQRVKVEEAIAGCPEQAISELLATAAPGSGEPPSR